MATKTSTFEVTKHVAVPKQEICSDAEKKRVFAAYNVEHGQLPRIFASDAGIQHLGVKPGDIIKVTRPSPTAGTTIFYRIVME